MKNDDFDLTIEAVNHQRNGISGRSFDMVYFVLREDGKDHFLIGILLDEQPGEDVCCFVVSEGDPTQCWRGDSFAPQLREAVNQYNKQMDRWISMGCKGERPIYPVDWKDTEIKSGKPRKRPVVSNIDESNFLEIVP